MSLKDILTRNLASVCLYNFAFVLAASQRVVVGQSN